MRRGGSPRTLFGAAAGVVLVVDLVTKALIESSFSLGQVRAVAGEWVQLRLVYNQGAAFGLNLGPYSRWIFLVIAILALGVLWRVARKTDPTDWFRMLSLGLVAGGATGNLVDRIRHAHGVVDFLDVGVGSLRWPTFNVADMGVTVGALALAISLWMEDSRRGQERASAAT
jgi:signal peptidase II